MASAIALGRAVRPKKVPAATNGGTTYPGAKKPGPATTTSLTPPAFTFDPALAARQREAELAEKQNLEKYKTEEHFNQTDLHTALKNLQVAQHREYTDLGLKSKRGNESLDRAKASGEERLDREAADSQKNASRQFEDFSAKRKEIGRQFGDLAQRQAESQNASGTLDQGTSAAAAAARARNQQIAEAPITTSEGRLHEDLATALGRIATARGKIGSETDRERAQLGEEVMRSFGRFNQDQTQKEHEARQQAGREHFRLDREEQRTKLAGVNAKQNFTEEEIWAALNEHPAAFKKWAEENPGLLPEGVGPEGIEGGGKSAADRARAAGERANDATRNLKGGRSNGGTTAPNKKRRR